MRQSDERSGHLIAIRLPHAHRPGRGTDSANGVVKIAVGSIARVLNHVGMKSHGWKIT